MSLYDFSGELKLFAYRVRVTLFGRTVDVYKVAASAPLTAERLVAQSFPWYKRIFLHTEWSYDWPQVLEGEDALVRLSKMDFVEDVSDFLKED